MVAIHPHIDPIPASEPCLVTELGHMRIVVVGRDEPARHRLGAALARAGYDDVAVSGEAEATAATCATHRPDLLVLALDISEVERILDDLRPLTDAPENLPVLVLCRESSLAQRRSAVLRGVRDLATDPIDEAELLLRVGNLLRARQLERQLDDRNAMLTETLLVRHAGLDTARESLSVLAAIADYHDDDTSQHAQRVGEVAAQVAAALGQSDLFVDMIRDAASLHDIGKVGISRRILLKPGKLTPPEWEHMMRHVEIGAQILAPARSPVLQLAGEIARTHHERWDGSGYLAGLVGEEIPLSGRITALADVWDTLTHERPYRPAWEEDRARAEIRAQAGLHFDPRVVQAFEQIDLPAHADSAPHALRD